MRFPTIPLSIGQFFFSYCCCSSFRHTWLIHSVKLLLSLCSHVPSQSLVCEFFLCVLGYWFAECATITNLVNRKWAGKWHNIIRVTYVRTLPWKIELFRRYNMFKFFDIFRLVKAAIFCLPCTEHSITKHLLSPSFNVGFVDVSCPLATSVPCWVRACWFSAPNRERVWQRYATAEVTKTVNTKGTRQPTSTAHNWLNKFQFV